VAGVTRRFEGTQAVTGLDLEIPAGEVVGLIGPSGSGKTTTIRVITGSLGPTAGTIEVLGERPSGTIAHPWQLAALVGIAGFLLFASWTLLWRELRPE